MGTAARASLCMAGMSAQVCAPAVRGERRCQDSGAHALQEPWNRRQGMLIAAILIVVLVGMVAGDVALVRALKRRRENSR